jgi:uncharacterized membrane protein
VTRRWWLTTVLAVAGIAVAGYLTWVHYDTGALVCGLGDCHTVQQSQYASVGPIPIALLGLGMYLVILAANLLARARPDTATAAAIMSFAVALGGAIYALYLTWLEVAVIGAICQWCVVSALLTLLLAVLTGLGAWGALGNGGKEAETEPACAASLVQGAAGRGTSRAGRARASNGRIST